MRASSIGFLTAVVLGLVGMIWGITMAISGDHSAMPAHAHLNLLGGVWLFLFGVFYHLHPAIDRSMLAIVQVGLWAASSVMLSIGVGLLTTGHPIGEPIAAVSSIVVVAAMALFGWNVLRRDAGGVAARAMAAE